MNLLRLGLLKFFTIIILFSSSFCFASEKGLVTGLPVPRFVSLKSSNVNFRSGHCKKFSIKYVYNRKGYPLELIAEHDEWRKLRDIDGVTGWVHQNLVSGVRNGVVIANHYEIENELFKKQNSELIIFRHPDESAYPMARMQFGSIVKLIKCRQDLWCKVKHAEVVGWVKKNNLWGVYPDEILN